MSGDEDNKNVHGKTSARAVYSRDRRRRSSLTNEEWKNDGSIVFFFTAGMKFFALSIVSLVLCVMYVFASECCKELAKLSVIFLFRCHIDLPIFFLEACGLCIFSQIYRKNVIYLYYISMIVP